MKATIIALCAAILAGCVTANDIQLSRNTYQLETRTGGGLFVGSEGERTMLRAAELTLANGYQRFVLVNASADQQTSFAGFTPGTANTVIMGNFATTTYTPGMPLFRREGRATATLIMLNPGDQGYSQGLDAAEVVARLKPKKRG